jgi:hypothetical protein
MATEHVLRLRITEAAKAAELANQRQDQRGYERACAAYQAADRALRVLEADRNRRAIEELEMSALPCRGGSRLSFAKIVKSGVPVEVLDSRGWETDSHGGMWLPPKPVHLAVVRMPPAEDEIG